MRIISDRNSRRSKGIAYIEFVDSTSVPLAIGLSGQRLLGVPIIVQASQVTEKPVNKLAVFGYRCGHPLIANCLFDHQAEKNRAAALANNLQKGSSGPMRLYVGSLHFNITEDMLRGIFEPFGRVNVAIYYLITLYYHLFF